MTCRILSYGAAQASLFTTLCWVLLCAQAPARQALGTTRIASGFSRPVTIVSPPGDRERLFVVEQHSGLIKIIKQGAVLPTPFLSLAGISAGTGNEGGLLGLAFHPDYSNNGRFFVHYTHAVTGAIHIVQFAVSATDPDVADPSSPVTILSIPQATPGHKGGNLVFSPVDGTLFIGIGDGGGNQNAPNAQNPQSLNGKILRLDVDLPPPHIPPNNPFVSDPNVRDEIWAFGVRQPWRYSFDRQTGDFYLCDVSGPMNREEINILLASVAPGQNFGWPCMDGFLCAPYVGCTCNDPSLTLPVHTYPHALGNCAVIGGYVYRGCGIPELTGEFLYGDNCSGRIWSMKYDLTSGPTITERTAELAPPAGQSINFITSFGEDPDGEIYICDLDGDIFKIISPDGYGTSYCSGKTNSLGCVPFVSVEGVASASRTAPFQIYANDVRPDEAGMILYGYQKRDLDFHGGKMCVKPAYPVIPLRLPTPSGPPPCTGVVKRDFNARIQSGIDPLLTPGAAVTVQWLLRDSNDPTGWGDSLTNAVRFLICP